MKLFLRVRVWLSDLIYPGDRAIGNLGNGEPGNYKAARGVLEWLGDEPAEDMVRRVREGEIAERGYATIYRSDDWSDDRAE